jgi:hypothetical protein
LVTADITTDTHGRPATPITSQARVREGRRDAHDQPGTTVQGFRGSSLVVTTTGKIGAAGTASPIVTRSRRATAPRAWGGVVSSRARQINVSGGTNQIEGFPSGTSGTNYGGSDDTHYCGTIKYARIEFAGYQLAVDNELNGLTVGGCGSQTELDNIQVHKGADDGIEFFGGTVDLKHAIITQPDDDGYRLELRVDWRVQFLVVSEFARRRPRHRGRQRGHTTRSPLEAHDHNASLIGSNKDRAPPARTRAASTSAARRTCTTPS